MPLEAHAGDCTANPTPACHLENGKKLIKTDPKRAAQELLESYKLDERTDTLELYAAALENDKQYALAAETWERIVKYRESEVTAAKEQKKAAAAATAQRKVTAATKAVAKLEANTARVRIKLNPGVPPKVQRDGVDVDITKEVIVKAGGDELVFAFADGSSEKVPVNLKAGENVRIDAPAPKPVKPADPPKVEPPKVERTPPPVEAKKDPAPIKKDVAMVPAEEPMPPMSDKQPSKTKQRVGIALVGGGVILAGVATTFGILASNDFDDAKQAGCDNTGACPFGSAGIDLVDRSNDRARVAQITAVGAGALVVTGVTLWMLGRKEAKRSNMTVHVSSSSAAFAWRF